MISDDDFAPDPRLAADSIFLADGPLSQLRLVDDRRFRWLVLVPRIRGAEEWIDLSGDHQRLLLAEVNLAGRLLREWAPVHKLNIGALGNIVRQLHVHVLARDEDDAAWPGPAWGTGAPLRYGGDERLALAERLREHLSTLIDP